MLSAMLKNVKILGTGSFLPERVLTNSDLEKMVETNDAWIRERTGITVRHIATDKQTNTDLALAATKQALLNANLKASQLDAIIYATVTPDQIMPSAACTLQAKLECGPIWAFDISAACSGFVYALSLAENLVKTGQYKHVLVVGAETLSRIVDFKDRETCILFGDGAGCVILGESDNDTSAFHSFHMRSNGSLGDLLSLETGRPIDPLTIETLTFKLPFVQMKGREIFKSAVRAMADCCARVMAARGLTAKDIDWLIPHQANIRIIQAH
jgi:3-oxoacyl-[acyl-carrier-protein] synthase III